jgi:hypothetical protein
MLIAARKLDQRRRVIVVGRVIAQAFLVIQAETLDQQVPVSGMLEVAVLVGVETGLSQLLAQNVVFLEPSPQHGKVVQDV